MWFKSESRGKFVHITYAAVHDEVYEEDQDERAKDAMIRYESRLDAYQFLLGKFENFKAGKGFHDLPEGLFGERNY
ncbi:aldose 1-epimerase [Streptococcus pneumoniae]|nr:aldose 1-epimerase [Streptococcus pneumoniae]